jgi:hypothetical protein
MSLTTRVLSALVVLTCASAAVAQWQDPFQPYRDSLKGLDRLILRVGLGFSDALPDDPREREITDLVKRRLADAGINVTVKESWEEDADRDAVLHLDVFFHRFRYLLPSVKYQPGTHSTNQPFPKSDAET